MNLLILLLFGILNIVNGVYRIPKYDACVLRVLLCDDFTKPLTPTDNSTLEMFEAIGPLNAVCDKLSQFRSCLKEAEAFCTEHSILDVGFQLLNNRQLAVDLCKRGSSHQHVYMMVEGCVNKYSHSAIKFCTDKAVETVGLDFSLLDFESECRFLGTMQHCHIAIITDKCGNIAGNFLQKLVIFRGERDFMCINYENERLSNLEAFYATMDSYVEQYKNIVYSVEKEDEGERIDSKNIKTLHVQDKTSSKFQSRISSIPDETCASDNEDMSNSESTSNPGTSHSIKKQPKCHYLPLRKKSESNESPKSERRTRYFYEQETNVVSDENNACKIKASFLVIGIRPNGDHLPLGWGEANVLWRTHSKLNDISCAWLFNTPEPMPLAKCSILLHHFMMVKEICKEDIGCFQPIDAKIAVYETSNERGAKRMAELRVYSFYRHSNDDNLSDLVIKFFQKHAYDIRDLCSKEHEEQNQVHYTSRKGLMSSDIYSVINGKSKISDQKYNFYIPGLAKYPIDTEIQLLPSEDGNLESEVEVEDYPESEDYDENPNSFDEELFNENYLSELFTVDPSALSYISNSYRPYGLFRPRVGETLEVIDQDLRMMDSSANPDVMSFEDAFDDGYKSHMHTEENCPALPDNVSNLKLFKYSKKNDPLNVAESERYEKLQIFEKDNDIPLTNLIWKVEETENLNEDNKQLKSEEIYVVIPSDEIEMLREDDRTVLKDLNKDSQALNVNDSEDLVEAPGEIHANSLTLEKNLNEDSQAFDAEDDSQDLVEAPEENDATSLTLEKNLNEYSQTLDAEDDSVDLVKASEEIDENSFTFEENLNEDSQAFDTEDDSQDLVEAPEENDATSMMFEKNSAIKFRKARNSRNFLEMISNNQNKKHPLFCKCVEDSTSHKTASEEKKFPSEAEIFSRRSGQNYPEEIEEAFNAFEILTKIKIVVKQIRKTLRDTRKGKSEILNFVNVEL